MFLNFMIFLMLLFVSSCGDTDSNSDSTIEEISQDGIIVKAISCLTINLPDKENGGNIGSITVQGNSGRCIYRYDLRGVRYTPNEESFKATDSCTFVYPESNITYLMNVDYSDRDRPECEIISSSQSTVGNI